MNNKPVLFLDFDGLQFNTIPITKGYIDKTYKINTDAHEYADHFDPIGLLTKYGSKEIPSWEDFWKNIADNCVNSIPLHRECQPMEGFVLVIKELSKKYDIWTVTARQKSSSHVVQFLHEKHIPGINKGTHHVWEHLPNNVFKSVFKEEFIKNFKGRKIAFIDDAPKEIVPIQNILRSILFDPNGVHTHRDDINERVSSWYEIGNRLL